VFIEKIFPVKAVEPADYLITFSPDKLEENPSLRLMLFGDSLFYDVLEIAMR
jgi:hypothetical protein